MNRLANRLRKTVAGVFLLALWFALVPAAQPGASLISAARNSVAAPALVGLVTENLSLIEHRTGVDSGRGDGEVGDDTDVARFTHTAAVPMVSRDHDLPPATGPPSFPDRHYFRARAPPAV